MRLNCMQYNIHDLIHVTTNLKEFIPNYFLCDKSKSLNNYNREPDLVILGLNSSITTNNEFQFSTGSIVGKHITFSDNRLHAKINTPFIRMLGVDSQIDIFITKYYDKSKCYNRYMVVISPVKIMNLPLINKRITGYLEKLFHMLIFITLIERGYFFLHASAVAYDDKGMILCGFSNTGKSPLVNYLHTKLKFKFMSDDHVILSSNGILFAYPESPRMYTILSNFISEKIPIFSFILGRKSNIFTKYLSINKEDIAVSSKLQKIIILKWGNSNIRRLNVDETLFHKLKVLNFEEILSSLTSPFTYLINYGAFIDLFPSLDELFKKSAQILNYAIMRSHIEAYEITFKTLSDAFTLISKVLHQ